jgi:alcohol dehydrogenase (cytochrome c)
MALIATGAFAQQPGMPLREIQKPDPDAAKFYGAKCATCHGPVMQGASGPSIMQWVRYHTDAELTAIVTKGKGKMPAFKLTPEETKTLMGDLRQLAGTNPLMATGGFTGTRPAAGGRGPGGPAGAPGRGAGGGGDFAAAGAANGFGFGGRGGAAPAGAATPLPKQAAKASPNRTGEQATITLTSGTKLTGRILSDYTDAAIIQTADAKVHLLARNGDSYTEKQITPKADWTTYHGNDSGNRYSTLEQINTSNVDKLQPVWSFPMTQQKLEATPIVIDGLLYMTGWNEIHALDATTGEELWSYSEPHTDGLYSEAGSGSQRGAAVAGDRIFFITDRAHLLGFDRFVGTKVMDVEMGKIQDSVSSTVAPMVVGDLVLAGVAGGEEGVRGFLDAYNVKTGKLAWRFYTIPERGEKAAETWQGAALEHGCGATWLNGAYDPQLNLIYWPVGNPCPDINGDERKGDNLYTDSVVALDPKTGKLKWYYQFTPHDTHDWDATEPLILVDAPWEGKPRKLLMHGDRNGMFYVLDRTNGQFLLGSKINTLVTWNNGFTKEGKPIIVQPYDSTPEGVAICPGTAGGPNWQEAAYSPVTKLFYVRTSDSCGIYQNYADPLNSRNRWYGQGSIPSDAAQKALQELRSKMEGGTYVRAIDPFTGKKMWEYSAGAMRNGVFATQGGLLFVGSVGGMTALDAKSGDVKWKINVGQNPSATASTYMIGGRQYIMQPGSSAVVAYALP